MKPVSTVQCALSSALQGLLCLVCLIAPVLILTIPVMGVLESRLGLGATYVAYQLLPVASVLAVVWAVRCDSMSERQTERSKWPCAFFLVLLYYFLAI